MGENAIVLRKTGRSQIKRIRVAVAMSRYLMADIKSYKFNWKAILIFFPQSRYQEIMKEVLLPLVNNSRCQVSAAGPKIFRGGSKGPLC